MQGLANPTRLGAAFATAIETVWFVAFQHTKDRTEENPVAFVLVYGSILYPS